MLLGIGSALDLPALFTLGALIWVAIGINQIVSLDK